MRDARMPRSFDINMLRVKLNLKLPDENIKQ